MDHATRTVIDALHGRVTELQERVVMLEAQLPHTSSSLSRIETRLDKMNNRMNAFLWAVLSPFIGLFAALIFRVVVSGKLAEFL